VHEQRDQPERVHRVDRLRHLIAGLLVLSFGCKDQHEAEETPRRFEAVKRSTGARAASVFCEQSFPANGEGTRAWSPPAERPVPGQARPESAKDAWTWVNLWASWCGPCVAEMPLLSRWRESLTADGVRLRFELWSVDEEASELNRAIAERKSTFPGPVRWLESPDALPGLLSQMGVEAGSAIPILALVDPAGKLRCVRVGAVGEEGYGAVRTILTGG